MLTKKPVSQKKVSRLLAAQVSDGEWAVVSDGRKALTESEANQIIAAGAKSRVKRRVPGVRSADTRFFSMQQSLGFLR
jgi:hypothetical protein